MSLLLLNYARNGVRAGPPAPPPPSGWDRPNLGTSIGPGQFAPAWEGKTVYLEESYQTPLAGTVNANGFSIFNATVSSGYRPERISYPVVATPLGERAVMEMLYPGQQTTLSATGNITPPWEYSDVEYTDIGVRIQGTWTGTLQFESSDDGGATWGPIELTNHTGPTASSTTSNGVSGGRPWYWSPQRAQNDPLRFWPVYKLFRVRAESWSSGAALVSVGLKGGQSPARGIAGLFNGDPTRMYTRLLIRFDEDWSNNGNVGTKGFFISQGGDTGNNHGVAMMAYASDPEKEARPLLFLQGGGFPSTNVVGSPWSAGVGAGLWLDYEWEFIANTSGNADGVVRSWINGQMVLNRSDISYFNVSSTERFRRLWLDPTYGGGFAPAINRRVQYAAWYRESAP